MTEREAAAASARPLPPLPEPHKRSFERGNGIHEDEDTFTATQMRAYARAASAPQAVRRPLTEEQIDALYEANCEPRNPYAPSRKFFGRTVRAAEFAHAIVPLAPQDTPKEGGK